MNELMYAVLALAAVLASLWYLHKRQKAPTDQQLKDWLQTLEAGGLLSESEYAVVDSLFRPGAKARYLKAIEKTRNSHCARALTVELIWRQEAEGKPISSRQLEILQKEGLLGTRAESKTPVPTVENGEDES